MWRILCPEVTSYSIEYSEFNNLYQLDHVYVRSFQALAGLFRSLVFAMLSSEEVGDKLWDDTT